MNKKYLFLVLLLVLIAALSVIFLSSKRTVTKQLGTPFKQTEEQPKGETLDKDSIPSMSERKYNGSDLKLEKIISQNDSYTRYYITYQSEGLKISGIMNVPNGNGPFPIIILNHGYVDPAVYRNGQGGLQREQDYFARNGFVVFQSDYRNYGQSDLDPDKDIRPRSGYVEDVLNGINALKQSGLPYLDKNNIGMLGHSMGGGVTTNIMVTNPDIAKAYVLMAPINSDYKINFDKWVKSDFTETANAFYERYGSYEENPEIWESFSAKNYLDKISRPVQIHQGTKDPDVPVDWSRDFATTLKNKNKDVTYFEYEGEGHVFYKLESLALERNLEFFNNHLK